MYEVTSTQLGSIAENLVATDLMLESKGRLSPFKPVADDVGIDLIVFDKHTSRAVPLQIKSRTTTIKRFPKRVYFQVRRSSLKGRIDGFLLAVLLESSTNHPAVERAWLIPMEKLEKLAGGNSQRLVFQPSKDLNSKDKFSDYRYKDISAVARRLIDMFDSSK